MNGFAKRGKKKKNLFARWEHLDIASGPETLQERGTSVNPGTVWLGLHLFARVVIRSCGYAGNVWRECPSPCSRVESDV